MELTTSFTSSEKQHMAKHIAQSSSSKWSTCVGDNFMP